MSWLTTSTAASLTSCPMVQEQSGPTHYSALRLAKGGSGVELRS